MRCSTRIVITPIGSYALVASAEGLCRVEPASEALPPEAGTGAPPQAISHADAAARALEEYFAGRRRSFHDLTLAPAGTPFQRNVWRALRDIPFGRTASYGEIARRIGRSGAARAVGSANHHNPLAIVTPCHRVVGGDGALVGYAGGLDRKAWLLAHEGALATLPGIAVTLRSDWIARARGASRAPRTRAAAPARATARAAGRLHPA
jgi:methylated-DNA-[protein]-cysteine S-methyltransferase